MALRDIFGKKRKVPEVLENGSINFAGLKFINPFGDCGIRDGRYGSLFVWNIIEKIFYTLENVRFESKENKGELDYIIDFLQINIKNIIWALWNCGFVCIQEENNYLTLVDSRYIKLDTNGEVIVPKGKTWHIYYDDVYNYRRKTFFRILDPHISLIDRYLSADDYLVSTYGSLILLTGKSLPIASKEKKELQDSLKDELGINRNRDQFIISNADMSVTPIDFHINDLELQNRINETFKRICRYFNIPLNILGMEDSTFNNQQEARRRYYSDCISPLCEKVLEIGRYIIKRSPLLIISEDLTFQFDNIDFNDGVSDKIDIIEKLISLKEKLDGTKDTEKIDNLIQKNIDNLI